MICTCEICGKTFSRRGKPKGAHTYCSWVCSGEGKKKRYTVVDNTTGDVVIEGGTAAACAEAMGVGFDSFRTITSLVRQGRNKRWTIKEE